MKPLVKHISNLLFDHDCVIVPGLGGFITNYKPAYINPVHNTFYPPSKQVTFNVRLNTNDGILAHSMAKNLGIDYNQAMRVIEHDVHSMKISLMKGQRIVLDQIGVLYNNKENNIVFEPSNEVNFLGESFGLPRFTASTISRQSSNGVMINKPVIRKTMRWAAILVPVATVALWSALNTGTINQIYSNYASIIPTAIESAEPSTHSSRSTERLDLLPIPKSVKETGEVVVTEKAVVEQEKFFIIAGAFLMPENAKKLVEQLKDEGYNASMIGENGRKLHLVSIQGFSSKEAADSRLTELQKKGFPSAWILSRGQK